MRSAVVIAALIAGCARPPAPPVPGATDIAVSSVTIVPRAGEALTLTYDPLIAALGLRTGSVVFPARNFNEYRLAEDRRRIDAFLDMRGRFDGEVAEPALAFAPDGKSVAVTWTVHEGPAYRITQLSLVGAPPEHEAMLREMLPFTVGSEVNLETYRPLRRTLAERLQEHGFGHARGYSRTFVDRQAKSVAWFYYFDTGPKTTIANVRVEGAKQVSVDAILERAHLVPGAAYSTAEARRAELALLDTGAFASAVVVSDADIQSGPPDHPDTGGVLAPEQVDASGALVPRTLPTAVGVRVVVVEAPRTQLRAELGIEGDPTRVDAYTSARAVLRNALGEQHHVVLEGSVGYGWIVDGDRELADGVYGAARAQYLHPGWLTRTLDLRVTGRWRDVLYPAAMLRELWAGPGVRSTVAPNTFIDVDVGYRVGWTHDLPMLVAMTPELSGLPASERSAGVELVASVIADHRNDKVEASDGWFASARASLSPGGPLGSERWLSLGGDLRAFHPLAGAWSIAARASGAVVTLADALPLGPRLFGGGAFGMRGFGRDRLSPTACSGSGLCNPVPIGGKSLVEASVELRLLPARKFYGAAVFVDVGGAGAGLDPFTDGVSAAIGLGARLRTWYIPIAIDVSYRGLDRGALTAAWDQLLVLFRIGEAF